MTNSSLSNLETSRKVLATCVLLVAALGFVLGYLNILFSYAMADEVEGLSVSDLRAVYTEPRFAVMVRGPMAKNAKQDGPALIDWALRGGPEEEYEKSVKPILIRRNCAECHNGFEQRTLATYDDIKPLLEKGMPLDHLATMSHAHMFGIGLVLAVVSYIFSFCGLSHRVKGTLIACAYAALVCDIGSWWGAKFLSPAFVYLILLSGPVIVASAAAMTVASLLSLWRPRRTADRAR